MCISILKESIFLNVTKYPRLYLYMQKHTKSWKSEVKCTLISISPTTSSLSLLLGVGASKIQLKILTFNLNVLCHISFLLWAQIIIRFKVTFSPGSYFLRHGSYPSLAWRMLGIKVTHLLLVTESEGKTHQLRQMQTNYKHCCGQLLLFLIKTKNSYQQIYSLTLCVCPCCVWICVCMCVHTHLEAREPWALFPGHPHFCFVFQCLSRLDTAK